MKNSLKKLILLLCIFSTISFVTSCSSRYIKVVNADAKTEFGITMTTPSQGMFFVENKKITGSKSALEYHNRIANSLYNDYGPSTDKRFVGSTNARQLKFITKDKTYLIDITKLNDRTAMILFDGNNKPSIVYNPKNYEKRFLKNLYYNKTK
ncbi:hypothetical protein [Flavobacterium sp. NKUCC04_CG]|uniref:hypothetical protein n=1 Tax=Flavobacterium sp. NKUCC04_CG TaxID=2842121 RepID=UPI001C5AD790|nr:hypothetical protein [Flavobacterium sp. NKUCC04_CG]MBW3518071.1 hypothetical protein [Flavobacterium sp. NKUCC04_CG]